METSLSNQIVIQAFSAFAGAFFAYLFTRIADFFSKVYQRQVKHYNSLVNLETQLNEIGGIINDDLYIIPKFIKAIKAGHVYFNKLRSIPIDKSHYENLYDSDLIDILFSFNYLVRKINDDLDTSNRGYEKLESALTQKLITSVDYVLSCNNLAHLLTVTNLSLTKLLEENTNLMARVRLEIKKDMPLGARLQFLFVRSKGAKISKQELEKEKKILELEIEESKHKSRKEIDDALKEAGLTRPS